MSPAQLDLDVEDEEDKKELEEVRAVAHDSIGQPAQTPTDSADNASKVT